MMPTNTDPTGKKSVKPDLQQSKTSHKLDKMPRLPGLDRPHPEQGLKRPSTCLKSRFVSQCQEMKTSTQEINLLLSSLSPSSSTQKLY
eukprot:6374083-Ditylum_brightwellii.AAC.1